MVKSGELIVVVDSVTDAIKFYTEKLSFDLIDLACASDSSNQEEQLSFAQLKKGKCIISFRTPTVEELAEFSFIKRCAGRCVGMRIDIKRGIDKYFQRCQKKGVKIAYPLTQSSSGEWSFSVRDNFGLKLVFIQVDEFVEKKSMAAFEFCGMQFTKDMVKAANTPEAEEDLLNRMIDQLRGFGPLRRAAKKCAKNKLKQMRAALT